MRLSDFVISKTKTSRLERKYTIPQEQTFLLDSYIKKNQSGLSEIYYQRQVNNIYFDDLSRTLFKDNLIGSNTRYKFRLRWYKKLNKVTKPQLEVKLKIGYLTYKLVLPLKYVSLAFPINVKKLKTQILTNNLPSIIKHLAKSLNPTLVNTYQRKYFLTADKKLRLTIDTDLVYYPQLSTQNIKLSHKNKSVKSIIELKYHKQDENLSSNLINQLPLILQKNSKYATGIAFSIY